MNAVDFITLAGRWAITPGAGAAQYRSAVSRAYYGAFHVAAQFLGSLSHDCPEYDGHDFVIKCLSNCGVSEAATVGGILRNLRMSRRDADYHLDKSQPETSANAKLCAERASQVQSGVAACGDAAISAKIKKGVHEYRTNILKR